MSLSFSGKAGVEAPVVLVLDAVAPGVGTALSCVPGVNDLTLQLYKIKGGGLTAEYGPGSPGDCLFGATSTTGTVSAALEAKVQLELTKRLKTGVYVGGQGSFDIDLCPDLAFAGFGGKVYAGAFAECYGFSLSQEVGAEIYWDFSGGKGFKPHLLAKRDLTAAGGDVGWRPIGDGPLEWGPTDRVAAWGRRAGRGAGESGEESVVENVIGLAGPSLVAVGSDVDILFVLYDTEKPWHARTDVGRVYWTEGEDPSLEAVTDDLAGEFSPEMVEVDGERLLAAWSRVEGDVSGAESPEDVAPHLEIVASWYERTPGTWDAPVQLTANGQVDRDPLAVLFGDTAGIVWVQNQGEAMVGTAASGDRLLFSSWTGTSWTAPASLWSAPRGILEVAFAPDDLGEGHLVFSVDEDGDPETVDDRELYGTWTEAGVWQPAAPLTMNGVEDSLPVLVAPEEDPLLVWKAGETLQYSLLADWLPRDVYPEYTAANEAPNLAGVTLPGGAAVGYGVQGPDGVDLVAGFYDAYLDLWSLPRQMTHDEDAETSLSMAYDGQVEVIEDVPQAGRTDLYVLRHALGSDPSVEPGSLTVTPANPAPGAAATVSVTLANQGDVPLEDVLVRLYSADPAQGGETVAESVLAGPVAAGCTAEAAFDWDVPADPNAQPLFVVVDPDQAIEDRDRSKNVVSLWTVLPDVAVETAWSDAVAATGAALTARVANRGVISAGAFEVAWRLGAGDGPEIGRTAVPGLAAGALHEATLAWDYAGYGLEERSVTVHAVADPDQAVREADTANNGLAQSVPVNIDGDLRVDIEPQGARDAGARWRRTGTTAWLESGAVEAGLAPGPYTVEFSTLVGWDTPAGQDATVEMGSTAVATGTYVINGGVYQVTAGAGTPGGVVHGAGAYLHNQLVTLTAEPEPGHRFLYWMEGGEIVSTESTISFLATGNRDLVAHFAEVGTSIPGALLLLLEE